MAPTASCCAGIHSVGFMRWDADLPADLVERMWHDPHALLSESNKLQDKLRCSVAKLDHPAGPFVWKHHNWGTLARTLKRSLSQSPAEKSWNDCALPFLGRRADAAAAGLLRAPPRPVQAEFLFAFGLHRRNVAVSLHAIRAANRRFHSRSRRAGGRHLATAR